jgi:hypothetical protein
LSSSKLFERSNIYIDLSKDKSVGNSVNLFPCNDNFFNFLNPDNKWTKGKRSVIALINIC